MYRSFSIKRMALFIAIISNICICGRTPTEITEIPCEEKIEFFIKKSDLRYIRYEGPESPNECHGSCSVSIEDGYKVESECGIDCSACVAKASVREFRICLHDIIPPTQEYICGCMEGECRWFKRVCIIPK